MEHLWASQLNKRVVPILTETINVELLPSSLSQIQFVDYRKERHVAVADLYRALGELPAARPMPEPIPVPPPMPILSLDGLRQEASSPERLSFERQSALFIKITSTIEQSSSQRGGHEVLRILRRRDDLFQKIAEKIDRYLGSAKVSEPTIQAATLPVAKTKTDWVGIVALFSTFTGIPFIGIGLGAWSLSRIRQSDGELNGAGWAWGAIVLNGFWLLINLAVIFSL